MNPSDYTKKKLQNDTPLNVEQSDLASRKTKTLPRRALLKSLFIGGAVVTANELPTTWTRPIVNSVLLPAHAETSGLAFSVQIRNLTGGQPMSPPAVIAHANGYSVGSLGSPASGALEQLAEGGDPSAVVGSASANSNVYQATSLGGPVTPGSTGSTTLGFGAQSDINVTVVTMLVVTNDAFVSATVSGLESLGVGQSKSVSAMAYDAGTEVNDEMMGNIPGLGGEGFNAENTGANIMPHPGVSSSVDIPAGAAFSGNVMSVTVTRTA